MRLLVLSYNGFSNQNANGKTLKMLLHGFRPDELAQFYCGAELPDPDFCKFSFHITDKQMLQSFFGKKTNPIFDGGAVRTEPVTMQPSPMLSNTVRKHNYNFALRWFREILWMMAPWGKKKLWKWIKEYQPQALFYMCGESIFFDRLVMRISEKYHIPIAVYNCEAFRIVDWRERRGMERSFYKAVEKSYLKLNKKASRHVFNCELLQEAYHKKYPSADREIISYTPGSFFTSEYCSHGAQLFISYFGNLGVGRVESLIDIADCLKEISEETKIHVFGRTRCQEDEEKLCSHTNIVYEGFVSADKVNSVCEEADILLHAESFREEIIHKLRFAFSTKIAQCLCAGRCLITYAPPDTASTQYLQKEKCAMVATSKDELYACLKAALTSYQIRKDYAQKALKTAHEYHDVERTAVELRQMLEEMIHEN